MITVDELTANISKRDKNKFELTSAKKVDKITGSVLQFDYDYCTLNKVNELITITQPLIYADGHTEEQTYYFIKIDGCLKLVSEQAFKLVRKSVLKGKKVVKGNNIPANSITGEEYINKFYKYQEQF